MTLPLRLAWVLLAVLEAASPRAHAAFQSAYELGRAEASLARPHPRDAVFYNPAAIAPGDPFEFFVQYRYNEHSHRMDRTLQGLIAARKDKTKQAEIVRGLSGKPLHSGVALGLVSAPNAHTAVAWLTEVEGNGVISGQALPIIDLAFRARSSLRIGQRFSFLHDQLVVGLTLSPRYVLDYQVREDALVLFEDRTLLKPQRVAEEGYGVGVDLGVAFQRTGVEHDVRAALVVRDVGATPYRAENNVNPRNSEAPPPTLPTVGLGLAWRIWLFSAFVPYFEAFYAQVYEPIVRDAPPTPHRFGATLPLGRFLALSVGHYKGQTSYGAALTLVGLRARLTHVREPHSDADIGLVDERVVAEVGFAF